MALIQCSECKQQVSDSAKTCPHCGAKVPQSNTAVKFFVVIVGLCVLLAIIYGSLSQTAAPPSPSTGMADKTAPTVAVDTTPHWTYRTSTDEMSSKPVKFASVDSINELHFGFPYQGAQRATLILRVHPRFGRNVILEIERGQFLCGFEDCGVMVRFDEGKPQRFTAGEPKDHSSNVLFIENYDRFLASARTAKKVYIAADFYQEGNNVLEFDTSALSW